MKLPSIWIFREKIMGFLVFEVFKFRIFLGCYRDELMKKN